MIRQEFDPAVLVGDLEVGLLFLERKLLKLQVYDAETATIDCDLVVLACREDEAARTGMMILRKVE
jgi:hypothetical protein